MALNVEVECEESEDHENTEAPEIETNPEEQEIEAADSGEADESVHDNCARNRHPPTWMQSGDYIVDNQMNAQLSQIMLVSVNSVGAEPTSVQEALNSQSAQLCQEAMNSEHSLIKNNIFKLVPLPEGHDVIDNKWVFRMKYNSEGSVERYKA